MDGFRFLNLRFSSIKLANNVVLQQSSRPLQASFSASSYAPSPISTPSRIINYKPPTTGSPFNNSLNSSTLSNSMSSPLAYRARQSNSIVRK